MLHPIFVGSAGVATASVAEALSRSTIGGATVLAIAVASTSVYWGSSSLMLGAAIGAALASLHFGSSANFLLLAVLSAATIARALPPMKARSRIAISLTLCLLLIPVFRGCTASLAGLLHLGRAERRLLTDTARLASRKPSTRRVRIITTREYAVVVVEVAQREEVPTALLWNQLRWKPFVSVTTQPWVRADVIALYDKYADELAEACLKAREMRATVIVCGRGTGAALALLCALEQASVGSSVGCVMYDPIRVGSEQLTHDADRLLKTCLIVRHLMKLPSLPQFVYGGLFPAPGGVHVAVT